MRLSKITYYLLFTLVSVTSLSGCSQDEYAEKQVVEQPKIEAQLILSVSTPLKGIRAPETTLTGKTTENECHKLTLFIMNADGSSIQDYSIEGESLQNKSLFFNVTTEQGQKKAFVAVNMTDAQITKIKQATDHNPAYTIDNITDITTENNFLMTGQVVTESGSGIINIEAEKTTKVKATLARVMSKVLLTCTTQDNNEEYVKLAQDNGYIRLNNVHYILDTTNKKFFPFAKPNNEDPNFNMSETLKTNYADNFFAAPFNNTPESGETAVKYDASRMQEGEYQYTEGVYCLENTINIDLQDVNRAKNVATYLTINAKFTPKNIDGTKNLSESDANNKLTKGTFYTCKKAPADAKDMCYSTIQKGIDYLKTNYNTNTTNSDFTIHTGGWQYYETFVNSPTIFSENAGLVRNNYYIINITSFTAPLIEKTIEVNTTICPWNIKGKTTIDIETGNNK
ncbi:Mfa1 family fimbria major subunit [Bacteroides sp.]|uniref:Mfa1 family fimbria major subunit n=1 Tax=Bacteroides sp. TaxID=29523 RepID=UPI002630CFAD|nr:Mfa1 family fimbria major subunit [Bacteroides sp.]MDD3038945.1 Mfa1 family fimbria major subunit [Bacteroides sp.]